MTKKTIIPLVLGAVMLTSCGDSSESFSMSSSYTNNISADSYGQAAGESYADNSYDNADGKTDVSESIKENNTSDTVIKKEMLVYSCNMTIDVLDFDTAISAFRNNLDTYDAILENENYSNGGSGSRWQRSDEEKWQTYYALVRVPSADYNKFCDTVSELGDLRSKNANVENMSREYYDLSAALEIYEAKEQRYMERLAEIQDEQYAIQVEEELTDIQIEISRIRTRMNDIQTDVAYSYVYVTMNEVKEYTAEPEKTDTFFQRLGNTVSKATASFLSVMENLLFMLIYLLPHAAVIGLIVFIIVKIVKFNKKRRNKAVQTPAETVPAENSD